MRNSPNINVLETFLTARARLEAAVYGRVHDRATTADLLQDVFLKLAALKPGTVIENVEAYVHRVAINVTLDHLRREKRRRTLNEEAHGILWDEVDEVTPERAVLAQENFALFRDAIADLPERSRRIFFMNRFDGRSHRDIAQALGVSETTVNFHVKRVVDHLARVRKDMLDHS